MTPEKIPLKNAQALLLLETDKNNWISQESEPNWVYYFCVPACKSEPMDAWHGVLKYESIIMFPNESRWMIPGAINPHNEYEPQKE